jgi:hypothetical protein
MCAPFVQACNYALQEISAIDDVKGLPKFSEDKRIVLVRNHDRAVGSEAPERTSLTKPDIVLLQWNHFKQKINRPEADYSESYGELCVSGPKLELDWRDVLSTVEMESTGLPKPGSWERNFDVGLNGLVELPPYVSLDDAPQPEIYHPRLPMVECECASF